jgi:hypothetical protein
MADGRPGWLYRYEARDIQRYVTATERLEEVAGASALVEALKDQASKLAHWAGGSIIADAAGSATIEFSGAGVQRFAEWWPMIAARVAPGLPMVQAAVDLAAHDHPLPALRALLDAAYQRHYTDLPEGGPLVHRSGRSGRPAVARGTRRGKRDVRDVATDRKVSALKSLQESGQVGLADDALGSRFLEGLDTGGRPLVSRHEDFGDSYVAVIHIDGNDMGMRVLSLPFAGYGGFAEALARAVEDAAQKATALVHQEDERRREARRLRNLPVRVDAPIPMRPIVLGGDDCTIITLAEDAIPFATRFLEVLEERGRQAVFGGRVLHATAGIAFIKPRAPFSLGLALADELCRFAKQCLRGLGGNGETPSSVLFHRVTTSGFAAWADISGQELAAVPPGDVKLRPGGLVYGPYRLRGERSVGRLGCLAATAKALPSGPLREWLRVARSDPGRSGLRWQRLKEVTCGRDSCRWDAFQKALRELEADPESGWGKGQSMDAHPATPIHDAITWGMVGTPLTFRAGPDQVTDE